MLSRQRRRHLRKDRRRPDDLRDFRQRLDLRRGVDDGGVQRGLDHRGVVAAPDDDAQLGAGHAGRVEARVVDAQPLVRLDHVE